MEPNFRFDDIESAIEDIRHGKMVILVDDADRENEGDLVCAAEKITPAIINFMAKHGRGLICLTLDSARVEQLQLPLMVPHNQTPYQTNFTVSIEAATGVTTGISAGDRARTIQVAMIPNAKYSDLKRPGHIFPLRAKDGGVLVRAGHTEGSVDLSRLAGCRPGGVICEIMNDDGEMARYPELRAFADQHELKLVTIADLIKYRKETELILQKETETHLKTEFGSFLLVGFKSLIEDKDYLALVKGAWESQEPILVRVHVDSLTKDIFYPYSKSGQSQLHTAMKMIEKAGKGVIVYLRQEYSSIDFIHESHAHQTQRTEMSIELNEQLRDYGIGAEILSLLGVRKMRLITNHLRKVVGIGGHDLQIVETVPLPKLEET